MWKGAGSTTEGIQQRVNDEAELPEDSNKKIQQQYGGYEQVDTKQYRCRPLNAVDNCAIVMHLLTYVIYVIHTGCVAYLASYSINKQQSRLIVN